MPRISATDFGSITVGDTVYEEDIIIRLDGKVYDRNTDLSRAVYGNSHTVSLQEAMDLYEEGAKMAIFGRGQYGALTVSDEADAFLEERGCEVVEAATPMAMDMWNQLEGPVIGLFHVTC